MPIFPTGYTAKTAAEVDNDDKWLIDVDGVTHYIIKSEMDTLFGGGGGGGATTLDGLTDVAITGVASNNVLIYSGTSWVNTTLAALKALINTLDSTTESGTSITMAEGHQLKYVRFTNAGAKTFTIPTFTHTALRPTILRNEGAGDLTIAASGSTLNAVSLVVEQHRDAVLIPLGSNVWNISLSAGSSGGDVTAPVFQSASVEDAAPDELVMVYNETLNSSSTPATGDFVVEVDATPATVSGVVVSGTNVTLTLAAPIANGEVVTVSYTPGTNKIEDSAGNDAAALTDEPVDNNVAGSGGGSGIWEDILLDVTSGTNPNTSLAYSLEVGANYYQGNTGTPGQYGHLGKITTKKLAAGEDGCVAIRWPDVTSDWSAVVILIHTTTAEKWKNTAPVGFRIASTGAQAIPIVNGTELTTQATGLTSVNDEMLALWRMGGEWFIRKSVDDGANWSNIYGFVPADLEAFDALLDTGEIYFTLDFVHGTSIVSKPLRGFNLADV